MRKKNVEFIGKHLTPNMQRASRCNKKGEHVDEVAIAC